MFICDLISQLKNRKNLINEDNNNNIFTIVKGLFNIDDYFESEKRLLINLDFINLSNLINFKGLLLKLYNSCNSKNLKIDLV